MENRSPPRRQSASMGLRAGSQFSHEGLHLLHGGQVPGTQGAQEDEQAERQPLAQKEFNVSKIYIKIEGLILITMALKIKKLNAQAITPTRGSPGAAGYDLYSSEGYVILPGRRGVVSTGISLELPPGVYGRVAPRSGLAVKHGLQVGAGVVDPDYTGEVKVVLFNHDKNPYVIKPGYRIAQLVLERFEVAEIEEVTELGETVRGEGGFGSTGV